MINSIDEIISSIRKGEMVIIMDDENRENEGDLVMASQFIKASDINFMASKGRGLICLTLTESKCKDLDLPLLKQSGSESSKETNFTVSIDAIKGVTTGISASDRARTIRAAVKKVMGIDYCEDLKMFCNLTQNCEEYEKKCGDESKK